MGEWDERNVDTYDKQRTRILLVDDEADFTSLLKINLERTNEYEVRTENVPTKALAAAQAFRPDLVILDFMMPGMDGGDVAAALRADHALKDTLILFLTAAVNKPEVDGWVNKISGPCLAKPVTPEELIAWIQVHLKRG